MHPETPSASARESRTDESHKRPGPAPGTGGRPPIRDPAKSLTVRLYAVDRERLDRLRSLWGHDSDTAALRQALEMADTMTRDG